MSIISNNYELHIPSHKMIQTKTKMSTFLLNTNEQSTAKLLPLSQFSA